MLSHIKQKINKSSHDNWHIIYTLKVRIPQRFLEMLISEVVISFLIFILICLGIITIPLYCPCLWISTVIFWLLTWLMAEIDSRNSNNLKHYYLYKVSAFILFLLVAYIIYMFDQLFESKQLVNTFYFNLFRISYTYGLSGDRAILAGETVPSFIFFYGFTLLIILLVPVIREFRKILLKRRSNWEDKARHKFLKKFHKSKHKDKVDDNI